MPPAIHEALPLHFLSMAITGITPPRGFKATLFSSKKGDVAWFDNYRQITWTNVVYKL
jgi:hypothetical protein